MPALLHEFVEEAASGITAGIAANRIKITGRFFLLVRGERIQPRIEFILRDVRGIKVGLRRAPRDAFDEWFVIVKLRPWAFIDHEIMETKTTQQRLAGRELFQQRFVSAPNLT